MSLLYQFTHRSLKNSQIVHQNGFLAGWLSCWLTTCVLFADGDANSDAHTRQLDGIPKCHDNSAPSDGGRASFRYHLSSGPYEWCPMKMIVNQSSNQPARDDHWAIAHLQHAEDPKRMSPLSLASEGDAIIAKVSKVLLDAARHH